MRYLLSLLLLIGTTAQAQYKSFLIGVKGDTLNRVDRKGLKQGPWTIHVDPLRGEPGYEEEGFFKNDKKEGRWVQYSLQGDKLAAENYKWGQKDGRCEYYNNAEDLVRVESWLARNPDSPYDTIPVTDLQDPTKILRYEIVKLELPSVKHGTWRYYDPATGKLESKEVYVLNKLRKEGEVEEDLAPIDPVTGEPTVKKEVKPKEKVKPKEVVEFEKKNAGKKKVKVRDGNTGG